VRPKEWKNVSVFALKPIDLADMSKNLVLQSPLVKGERPKRSVERGTNAHCK